MNKELENRLEEIKTMHKKLMRQLIGEEADIDVQKVEDEKYRVKIKVNSFLSVGEYEAGGAENQAMDNVLNAIEEFILS